MWSLYDFFCLLYFNKYNSKYGIMSLDLCLKQLHVVHIEGFQRICNTYVCSCSSPSFSSPSFSSPSFSSPANSTPATLSVIFQSFKFHPLFFDGPSFFSPANSSHPSFSSGVITRIPGKIGATTHLIISCHQSPLKNLRFPGGLT